LAPNRPIYPFVVNEKFKKEDGGKKVDAIVTIEVWLLNLCFLESFIFLYKYENSPPFDM
jgi:hypothetical protein